jgi:hypothetical protein
VWADAANRVGAYQPPTPVGDATAAIGGAAAAPETVDGPPDWRGLLDLLEENTSASYDDLWRTWVARDSDLALLDARKEARARYDAVVAGAGDWRLPRAVRDAMRAWRFDQATTLLSDAAAILEQRTAIASAAATSGLTAPTTLRAAFESPDGFASATLEVKAELEAIARYNAAVAARVTAPDALQAVGLWNAAPQSDLDEARSLFATGDMAGSASAAGSAFAAWAGAEDIGRGRLVSLGLLALAFLIAVFLLASWLRGRHRAPLIATPGPYATLAATPDPVGPVEAGDRGAGGTEPD